MADPIIKPISRVVTAMIDAMVAQRPSTLTHFNANGRWMDVPALMRAQGLLAQARLASEVKSARLSTAGDVSFDALRALCASEFDTSLPADPQRAQATVTLTRTGTNPGVIPAGFRFVKLADPNAQPLAVPAAAYVVAKTLYVAAGQLTATVTLDASSAGANSNVPTFTNFTPAKSLIQPAQTLFDTTWTATTCTAGGGSSGVTTPVLVAAARARAAGQFGPTDLAVVAGILTQQSVRHYALFPGASGLPYTQVYVADESWGWDSGWATNVAQALTDPALPWVGFGCRARVGEVVNMQITIAPTIVLNSTDDLTNTDEIDANVKSAAEAYFNDRTDWYRWRFAGLRSAISAADPRIQACTSVTVSDAQTGNALFEPANTFGQAPWQNAVTHYYLTDQNVQSTYAPPS